MAQREIPREVPAAADARRGDAVLVDVEPAAHPAQRRERREPLALREGVALVAAGLARREHEHPELLGGGAPHRLDLRAGAARAVEGEEQRRGLRGVEARGDVEVELRALLDRSVEAEDGRADLRAGLPRGLPGLRRDRDGARDRAEQLVERHARPGGDRERGRTPRRGVRGVERAREVPGQVGDRLLDRGEREGGEGDSSGVHGVDGDSTV
jgi:hypothetical protein